MQAGALLNPDEMARADALAPSLDVPSMVLMENAGRAVARAIQARIRPCRTLVLCGPGNNGGDGYVIARRLAQAGWPVSVAALAPPRAGGDAAGAAGGWHGPNVAFDPGEAARAALVIDAVFGAGLSRDVDGIVAETLRAATRVVAVDTPSGVDGTTGLVRGYAPQAELTVTFFRAKPGHLLLPGRDLCGELVVANIGMPEAVLDTVVPAAFANGPGLWRLPSPAAADHKYARGHVTVLGGPEMTGAGRLAAEAARPGLGAALAGAAFPALLAAGRTVVGDADLFTACAGNPAGLQGAGVLTPHGGEFARVFGDPGPDRMAAVRAAAAATGAVVLLKGSDTIIASPDGRAAINADAPPWLATAGAGDVLAGLIAGLLASGMAPWEAACAGAWLHGRAAVHAGHGLVADDLPARIPQAITDALGSNRARRPDR